VSLNYVHSDQLLTSSSLRPPPLRSTIWAFLFPPVPLVPSVPSDVSDAGRSPAQDATLFPSDEQLSQRTLWISFLIALGWTLLGLGGALPLYLVSTPCLADSGPQSSFGGVYSTLQDLSLLRLLRLLDNGNATTPNIIQSRAIVNGKDATQDVHTRLIVLTVLVLVLGLLPALWKILKEFNRLVAYRKRWIEVRCQGKDMGWLSARKAPGFVGWGEKKLKDFILKTGLSSSLERNGDKSRRREHDDAQLSHGEEASLEVDIQSLFSIG
jgi:calcium permeable stress-gated cation channel